MSRLAAGRRVVFVEEPVVAAGEPHWKRRSPTNGVEVWQPQSPSTAPGFCDEQLCHLLSLLGQLRDEPGLEEPIAWLYTPMALPLAQAMAPRAMIYDCMDELTSFLGAPPELAGRETDLLAQADLVFTGGRSLYRVKQGRNPRVYCFPSSVDAAHFRRERGVAPTDPPDQAGLRQPRFGYVGVIDERLDLALLDVMARTHPEWEVVLVGPVVKIDPATLPLRPNIHYLGQRTYDELPAYLAHWDVCLLPFAQNLATRFISPTKTLEYMAAERPIVSTPITDVVEPYGHIVYVGSTPGEFVTACERALHAPAAEREARTACMRSVLAQTSWVTTARAMEQLIRQTVVALQPTETRPCACPPNSVSRATTPARRSR
jgi:UDP-galactopyranose mutase